MFSECFWLVNCQICFLPRGVFRALSNIQDEAISYLQKYGATLSHYLSFGKSSILDV